MNWIAYNYAMPNYCNTYRPVAARAGPYKLLHFCAVVLLLGDGSSIKLGAGLVCRCCCSFFLQVCLLSSSSLESTAQW
jgi:hypothetical protein